MTVDRRNKGITDAQVIDALLASNGVCEKAAHTSIHTGHKHHERVIEKGGTIVEQHPTLAARDSHGSRLFEYSRRAAKAITFHRERGEQSRVIVMP